MKPKKLNLLHLLFHLYSNQMFEYHKGLLYSLLYQLKHTPNTRHLNHYQLHRLYLHLLEHILNKLNILNQKMLKHNPSNHAYKKIFLMIQIF